MSEKSYLAWMASETIIEWTNDSAVMEQLDAALAQGAVGTTTNPPLSYEGLVTDTHLYADTLKALRRDCTDDEFALEAMGVVVKNLSRRLMPMHKERGGHYGCVRAQLPPHLADDGEAMLKMGRYISTWGENVMIKIPGTQAGVWVMEELAALGIPTNPTVLTTFSQIIASAEATERGMNRAQQAGIKPAWTTEALVFGRLYDYLAELNAERSAGITPEELQWAVMELLKRTNRLFVEKKYRSVMQGAAFRCAMHVEQLVGGRFCSTIHPKMQRQVEEADKAGAIRRELCIDEPVKPAIIDKVARALPEYRTAIEPDAIQPADFAKYGATAMTLDNFDVNGWQRLKALKAI